MMNVHQISQLSIEHNLEDIIRLPQPEESALANAKQEELYKVAQVFSRLWQELVMNQITLSSDRVTGVCSISGKMTQLEGVLLWDRVLLSLGSYYDFAARAILPPKLTEGKKEIYLIPGLNSKSIDALTAEVERFENVPDYQRQSLILTGIYFNSLFMSYFLRLLRQREQLDMLVMFEKSAHRMLMTMYDLSQIASSVDQRLLANRLFRSSLEYLVEVYSNVEVTWNQEHYPGVFSKINLPELSLLAKRAQVIVQKYGEKEVEKVFEQQLALIAQSLGFYVVSTRRGERTVDLVCISGDPYEKITVLLEAKTSTKPYSLPTKDERALVEYIEEVKRSLRTLPPLKYVLIVGHRAGQNLEKKLAQLQERTEVPIRFCAAQDLADLRESIPGSAPLRALTECILRSSHILPRGFATAVAERYTTEQEAHSDFVRKMLSSQTSLKKCIDALGSNGA
jgi:hypothetical protein